MPKESVRCADYHFEPIPEGREPKVGESVFPAGCRLGKVEIGWTKKGDGGYVEIGTTDEVLVAQLVANVERATKQGDPVLAVVEFFSPSSGIWMTLDRDGINDLIHKLRKARDDAFGRDA